LIIDHFQNCCLISRNLFWFADPFTQVDIVEIVEILRIEATKHQQTAADKIDACSSSGLGIALHLSFYCSQALGFQVNHKNVVEIVTESASKNIDLILEAGTGMAPSGQEGGTAELHFLPLEAFKGVIFH
jgi:hypothetical protein